MSAFRDERGRRWELVLTHDAVGRVFYHAGVDIYDVLAGTKRCPACERPWVEIIKRENKKLESAWESVYGAVGEGG